MSCITKILREMNLLEIALIVENGQFTPENTVYQYRFYFQYHGEAAGGNLSWCHSFN